MSVYTKSIQTFLFVSKPQVNTYMSIYNNYMSVYNYTSSK